MGGSGITEARRNGGKDLELPELPKQSEAISASCQ